MDAALEQFKCACTSTEYRNGIKMLYIYLKNIYDQPKIDKYRKIRTGNEKFNSNVWCHETCRTILLLAGFEQVGEYIELSSNADVTELYNLLQKQLADLDGLAVASHATSTTTGQRNATLSLAVSNQGGLFAADMQADLTLLSYMVEMGYSKHAAERGLVATKNQGVQPAMDWIASHPECHEPPVQQSAQHSIPCTAVSTTSSSTSQDRPNVTSRLRSANEQKYAYQEKLRLEAIKKAKLDKAEDEMAKKYLKQNMQSERQENKEKFEREKVIRHVEQTSATTSTASTSTLPTHDDNLTTLRIRTHDGKVHTWETGKESSLKDLYSYVCGLVEMDIHDFHISIPHPHEVLDSHEETTLLDKGLHPKATVVIQKIKQEDISTEETATDNVGNRDDTDDILNRPVSLATHEPVEETETNECSL